MILESSVSGPFRSSQGFKVYHNQTGTILHIKAYSIRQVQSTRQEDNSEVSQEMRVKYVANGSCASGVHCN